MMSDRSIRARAVALVCAAAIGAAPVAAHAAVTDAAAISASLKALNLPADVVTNGDIQTVDSTFGPNMMFSIYLSNCETAHTNCKSVMFEASFTDTSAGIAEMNTFNNDHRFARGVIDVSGEPAIRMDLPASAVSGAEFEGSVTLWRRLMSSFAETIFPS